MADKQLVRFKKGEILFREGDNTSEMFIIQSGSVKVYVSKGEKAIPITELEKGNFVGEMSFLSGTARTATVIAQEQVLARRIGPEVLARKEFGVSGWALSIARVLVSRLRKTTTQVADYMYRLDQGERGEDSSESASDSTKDISGTSSMQPRPLGFSLRGSVGRDEVRLFLKGVMTQRDVETLKKEIRHYQMNVSLPMVIDFSDVMDLDKDALNYVVSLTRGGTDSRSRITIDNVQLLKDKILTIRGIQEVVQKAQLPVRRLDPGELLIRQGDEENNMYIIKSGQFTVSRNTDGEEVILGTAVAGDVVGEMALIRGGNRSASVKAEKASVVSVIDTQAFYRNTYHVPSWFMEIIRGLVFRLRQTNQLLSDLVHQQNRRRKGLELGDPLKITIDGQEPGVLLLEGDLSFDNLEYAALMVDHILKKKVNEITLDLSRVKEMDPEAIRYLINTSLEMRARGQKLQLESPPKALMEKLRGEETFLA